MSENHDGQVEDDASAHLAGLEKAWDEAPTTAPRGGRLPDGKYVFAIDEMRVAKSNAGNWNVKWTLLVLTPIESSGRKKWKDSGIEEGKKLNYLKAELHTCGLDCKVAELPKRVKELEGAVIKATLKTQPKREGDDPNAEPFQNVYIDELVAPPGDPVYAAQVEHVRKQDVSFDTSAMGGGGGASDGSAI